MSNSDQKFHVTNIMWDLDPEDEHIRHFLPGSLYVEIPSESVAQSDNDELAEMIGDILLEQTGYCHYGFDYELVGTA